MSDPSGVGRDRLLLALAVGVGALLRVRDYLVNRSLWLDEAYLALNVLGKSTADLILRPLEFNQAAPPGFLLLAKGAVALFGSGEYALRLVPLLFSLAGLLLLAWIVARTLPPGAGLLAMALVVFRSPLIQYAAEFKQYGLDVAVGLGVTAAALPFVNGPAQARHAVVLALAGAAGPWLSHPALFFLATVGLVLVLQRRVNGRPAPGTIAAIGVIWAVSAAAVYAVSLRDLAAHQYLRDAWSDALAPSVLSVSTVPWLVRQLRGLVAYAFGGSGEALGAFAVLAGCAAWLPKRPPYVILFAGPIGAALAAALLGRYPFQGRLLLFAFPLLAVLAAAGVGAVRGSRAVTVLLAAALLLFPVAGSLARLARPNFHEEMRPVIAYVQRRSAPGDAVYLTPYAEFAFRYYAPRMGFSPGTLVTGTYTETDWTDIAGDLDQLRGRGRVWVLLSHVRQDERQFILHSLNGIGTRLDAFSAPGTAVFLYDFR